MAETYSSSDTQLLDGTGPPRGRGARLERGVAVGRYVVGEVLGEGGMGTVYAARDPELGRAVAIKLLDAPRDEARDPGWQLRLAREAQAMARLSHPNVLTIYDMGVMADGRVFVAMEIAEGGTLRAWLKAKPRKIREVLGMFIAAGEGLAAAHRAGIVHRDFKPDNVLLGLDERPRVTDFGLARAVDGRDAQEEATPTLEDAGSLADPLTRVGTIMGTPGYMAPEQYRGGAIDPRTDIYAFCASLYHALYDERPFHGRTLAELANAVHAGQIKPSPRSSQVPAWVRKIIVAGLAVDPDRRPASMAIVLAALRNDPTVARRNRAMALTAAVLAVGALFAYRQAAQRRIDACRSAAHALHAAWTDERKATVASAFAATKSSLAGDAWINVRTVLDAYVDTWERARFQTCEAGEIAHSEAPAFHARRVTCLEERAEGFRALGEVLVHADGKTVRNAPDAVRQLEDIAACSNAAELDAIPLLPADPVARGEVETLRRDMQRAHALSVVEQATQSLAILQDIRPRVERTGYGPLMVRFTVQLALRERSEAPERSVEDFETAILLAETHRLDRAKALAQISLGSLLGSQMSRTKEGHWWLRHATATLARLGSDPSLLAERDVEEGWIYLSDSDYAGATAAFERALANDGAAVKDDVPRYASALSGLSGCRIQQGRFEEAVAMNQRAVAIMAARDGAHHPKINGFRSNLALILADVGRGDEALAAARDAAADVQALVDAGDLQWHSYYAGVTHHTLGYVLMRKGDYAEAERELDRALVIHRKHFGPGDITPILNERARVLRFLHRPSEALQLLAEAHELGRVSAEVDDAVRATTCTEEALARIEMPGGAANAKDAWRLLEKAEELQAKSPLSPYERATLSWARGRVLTLLDPKSDRAAPLMAEARGTFERLHAWAMLAAMAP